MNNFRKILENKINMMNNFDKNKLFELMQYINNVMNIKKIIM